MDGTVSTNVHPYQHEINHITYPERMFQIATPIPPKSFEDTPFLWVSTPSEFATMLDKLRSARELAVDLEHHSYRSWSGFLCLMQISTREEDFVLDTLELRGELFELNEVFTDPRIVKVSPSFVWLDHHSQRCAGFSRRREWYRLAATRLRYLYCQSFWYISCI